MKKRILSAALVLVLMFTLLSTLTFSASAASANSTYNCDQTKVLTVKTGTGGLFKPSITFKCKALKEFGSRGISNYAPKMSLKIYDHSTGTTSWKRITGTGSSISSTLKLERGRTYTITVSYIFDKSVNYNAIAVATGRTWAEGTWWITSTNRINSLTIR